jgi:predicted transposase YdaD
MNAGDRLIARGREQGRVEGRVEGREEGLAGLRRGVRTALTARGIPLSEPGQARLAGCTDMATLTTWLARAVTAASEAEVFADGDAG